MNIPSFLAMVSSALLIGACGSSSPADFVAPDRGATVRIDSFAFSPKKVTLSVGDTITWLNEDAIAHTVTSGTPSKQGVPGVTRGKPARHDGTFDGALDGEGAEFSFTFGNGGSFAYYCDIHAGMQGTVVVHD